VFELFILAESKLRSQFRVLGSAVTRVYIVPLLNVVEYLWYLHQCLAISSVLVLRVVCAMQSF
jgi:hypothetical protein